MIGTEKGSAGKTAEAEFDYEKSWALKNAPVDHKEAQRVRQTLDLIPGDVRTVLDAGCGDGRVSMALSDQYRVVGIDVSYSALSREARRRRVAGVLTQLPFRDRAFDLVLISEVIEHIPAHALPQVLGELRRVSRQYVLVTVPYRETLEDGFVRCECGFVFHKWGHLQSYDEARLVSLYPDMAAVRVQLLGGEKPADPRWLKRLERFWGGRYAEPDADTSCPECHGRSFAVDGGNAIATFCHYSSALAARMLPKRRATWIGGLFQMPAR